MDRLKELKRSDVVAVRVDELGFLGVIHPPEVPEGVVQLVEEEDGCKRTQRERICEDMVLVKSASQNVKLRIDGLRTEDGLSVSLEMEFLLRLAGDDMDAESLFPLVAERGILHKRDIIQLVEPILRKHLEKVLSSISVEACFSSEGERGVESAVTEAFKEVRFRYGIALKGLLKATFKSRDYERIRSAKVVAEQKAKQVEVLKSYGVEQKRAEEAVLELRTEGLTRFKRLFIASNRKLLVYDPESLMSLSAEPVEALKVSAPVRSVRVIRTPDGERLGLGTLDTVLLYDMRTFKEYGSYTYDADTTHGFNSTTASGEHLYGSHSRFGLLRWDLKSGEIERLWRRGARSVCSTEDGEVFFASADSLLCASLPPRRLYECGAEINSVTPMGRLIALATTAGDVILFNRDTDASVRHSIGAKIYSAAVAELPSGDALLLGTKSSGLHALLVASGKTILFEAKEPVRWVAGASDIVVGVSYSLSSLLIWETDSPSKPRKIPLPSEAYDITVTKDYL